MVSTNNLRLLFFIKTWKRTPPPRSKISTLTLDIGRHQLKMDPVEREWRKCRIVLDINKYKWINHVLPRNKVPDDLKNIINIRFFYLYEYFNYEERIKDAAMLEIIREDIRELTEHLVSAASLSNMVPSVSLH